MSEASTTAGTKAYYNGLKLGEVKDVSTSGETADLIDVTHLDSPGNRKEYKPGFIDGGDLTLTFNAIATDSGQQAVQADFGTNSVKPLTIDYPSGTSITVDVVVQKAQTISPAKVGAVEEFTVTFKLSGPVSRTYGVSAGLTALAASVGSLNPVFAVGTTEYIIPVPNGTASLTLTPTATGVITMSVNGGAEQTVASGSASTAITTAVGITTIVVKVKETGKAAKSYTVRVSRVS